MFSFLLLFLVIVRVGDFALLIFQVNEIIVDVLVGPVAVDVVLVALLKSNRALMRGMNLLGNLHLEEIRVFGAIKVGTANGLACNLNGL